MFSLTKALIKILVLTSVPTILNMNPIEEVVVPDGKEVKVPLKDLPEECGYKRPEPISFSNRIIGGNFTDISKYPWMVSLQINGHHFCGGSLIESQWVLTAAHCLDSIGETEINSFEVIAGTQNLSDTFLFYGVSKIVIHPLYVDTHLSNDIGLIKLKRPIPLRNKNCKPVNIICLPESPEQTIANTLTTIGWGVTESEELSLEQLMFVNMPFVSSEQCKTTYGEVLIIESMICAGEDGKDSCQGDSGGGLIQWDDKGKATIVGIVSFGIGCGLPGYPGVYTRVHSFIDWIQNVIKDE